MNLKPILLFGFPTLLSAQLFARENPVITITLNSTNTTCGRSNGSIVVTAMGGVAPYSYSLNGGTPQPSNVFLYLAPGFYTVSVTDATMQTGSSSTTLTNQFTAPTTVGVQKVLPTGCTTQDASLTLTGTGGTPPYTYSIDHTNFQASNYFPNLYAGSYYCAVKDANGCESPYIWWMTTQIPETCPIRTAGEGRTYICNPFESHITLQNVFGGTPPYQYSLDGINFQASYDFFWYPAGLYTVTIKDANGNMLKYSVALHDACTTPFDVIGIVVPAQCGLNGSITINVNGGTAPYLYSIDGINFQSSNQFTGLMPGNYTVTVKDVNDLIASKFFIVGNGCISLSSTIVNSTCGRANGTATIIASNGTPPYLYSINGGPYTTNNQFNNLLAGTYSINVKDATGGISVISVTLIDIPGPNISSVIATPASCTITDGTIVVNAQNGTPPLQYSIDGVNFQSGASFNGLAAGSYTALIKDVNDCTASGTTVVNLNNTTTANAGSNQTICEGQSITLAATSNGNSFSWSPVTGLNNSNILSPVASPTSNTNYTLTATSGNCTAQSTVSITVNKAPTANAGRDTSICFGKNVQLNGTGGNTYLWSPVTFLDDKTLQNPTVMNATSGNHQYSLTVKDVNGCSSLTPSLVSVNVFSLSVFGGRDTIMQVGQPLQLGALDINNANFISYTWSPPSGLSNPNIANPVATLNSDQLYTVTAMNASGCSATDDVKIQVFRYIDIYVPTAFTPNNDGRNDVLKAIPVGIKEFKNFSIYNRSGQLVFQTSNATIGWTGNLQGLPQYGVHVWVAEGVDYKGNVIKRKGTVVVIR